MLVFSMGVGVAPVLHLAEDGEEINEFLAAVAHFQEASAQDLSLGDEHAPHPPSHHVPDDVDCLFCQLLVSPTVTSSGDLSPNWDLTVGEVVTVPALRDTSSALSGANSARAPPRG
jgi:ferredoxin-NADP reductase